MRYIVLLLALGSVAFARGTPDSARWVDAPLIK
jgi:hypothetical protein